MVCSVPEPRGLEATYVRFMAPLRMWLLLLLEGALYLHLHVVIRLYIHLFVVLKSVYRGLMFEPYTTAFR